eukprot:XP_001689736.1 predicted protein [Chlamydomonas reinhardtii]
MPAAQRPAKRTRRQAAQEATSEASDDAPQSSGRGAASAVENGTVDLDAQRKEIMLRNQQRLQELGLTNLMADMRQDVNSDAAKKTVASSKAKRSAASDKENGDGEQRVVRRSLRNRGQEPELPPLLEPLFRKPDAAGEQPYSEEERKARPPRPPSAAAADGDAHKYDSHNLHR